MDATRSLIPIAREAPRPMLHLVLLFGPSGHALDAYFDRAVLWLDKLFGDVVQLSAAGDLNDQGDCYRTMLAGKGLDRAELLAKWHMEVEAYEGPVRAARAIEHETCQRLGVRWEDLPCIVMTVDVAPAHIKVLPIHRATLAKALGDQRFYSCLARVFAADRVRSRLECNVPLSSDKIKTLINELSAEFELAWRGSHSTRSARPRWSEGAGGRGTKRLRGRPRNSDHEADAKVAETWALGRHATYAALGDDLGKDASEVRKAVDRDRKWKKRHKGLPE